MAALPLALALLTVAWPPPTRPAQDPPIANVRLDPGTRRLVWDERGNVSEVQCSVDQDTPMRVRGGSGFCQLHVVPACRPSTFTVAVTRGPRYAASFRHPELAGDPSAAPERLSCWVHDWDLLTCRWTEGRTAPKGAQYRLFWEDLQSRQVWECERYGGTHGGTHDSTHFQCEFRDVGRGHPEELQRFLVNGTGVPCAEIFVELGAIERLDAPNVTGSCNQTWADVQWHMAARFQSDFSYEVVVHRGSRSEKHTVSGPSPAGSQMLLPNPGNLRVRVRALTFDQRFWSPWSPLKSFECEPARAQDDFDLSDALGGDDPKPTARLPKKPVPGDDLNLEDALNGGGHNDPPPPDPPKPRPNPNPKPHQPGTSGSFSDSDLVDGNAGGGGGGAGGPGSNWKDDGETQADSPGVISGIVGAVLVAVGGAISSAIAYQRKKWCFKQDDGAKA
ncbi:interleukin-3 receptor subunit alpha-like isoform X2 [Erinaceus europaeus]|uniref:Interleukin-3 receptor subunit alpha-like isoform X2 n=1 Tax=Erinaceus europaeus TaxID=9365 RepID=A0ABM3WRB9_ERIEU|nr:interleukin-3 receptor subunit alpha-like isoform X2 [Erinaceus europaeus]